MITPTLPIALNVATFLSMADHDQDPIPDPDPETLDLICDSIPGVPPLKRAPEQRVADMQRHLKTLQEELADFLRIDPEDARGYAAKVRKDIRDIEARVREYELQRDAKN